MEKVLYLIGGGAIGTLLRYFSASAIQKLSVSALPWGTIFVNLVGSLIIGFCWGIFENRNIGPHLRLFLFVGVFGSFTTFSTFSLESMNLFRSGDYINALANIFIQNILALALVFGGFLAARLIFK